MWQALALSEESVLWVCLCLDRLEVEAKSFPHSGHSFFWVLCFFSTGDLLRNISMTNSESSMSEGVGEEDVVEEVVDDAGEIEGEQGEIEGEQAEEQKLRSIASS